MVGVTAPILRFIRHGSPARVSGAVIGSLVLSLALLAACGGDDEVASATATTQPASGATTEVPTEIPTLDTSRVTAGASSIVFQSKSGTPAQGQGPLTGGFDIYVMDPDGGNTIRITDDVLEDTDPAWSPDGSMIAFTRGARTFVTGRGVKRDIHTMSADGSNQVNLTNENEFDDQDPDWSPDGTQIAFHSERDGNNEIYVINANGSGQTRLTEADRDDIGAQWSPDGAKIAFTSSRDGDREVYVMNSDGSNQTRITDRFGEDSAPAWSPDGTKLAFVSDDGGDVDIWVMNPDGSNRVNLTDSPRDDRQPQWSSDGSGIVFWSLRDGDAEIYSMDADGSNQTRLTEAEGSDVGPEWFSGS